MALLPQFLEELRRRVSIFDVVGRRVRLNRRGLQATGLCPFHNEKSPSFHVYEGPDEPHYHCFGCGAHGDAIQFLMTYQKLSFHEAIETLAQRFGVPLEVVEGGEEYKGPSKALMRDALTLASRFFHFYLLHTDEGHLDQPGIGVDTDLVGAARDQARSSQPCIPAQFLGSPADSQETDSRRASVFRL